MATDWSGRLSRVDAAADRHFSERIKLIPLAGGRYAAGVADPNRQAATVRGRLHVGVHSSDLGGEGSRAWNTVIAAGRALAEITIAQLPQGYELRKDDRVEALDRGRVFIVERVHGNEENIIRIELSEASP